MLSAARFAEVVVGRAIAAVQQVDALQDASARRSILATHKETLNYKL